MNLSGARAGTYISVHAYESMVIVVNPSIAGLTAGRGIAPIHVDRCQSRARRPLEWGVYRSYFGIATILQLFVIAPMIGHKSNNVLGEVVPGNNEHQ